MSTETIPHRESPRIHCACCDKPRTTFAGQGIWIDDGQPTGTYPVCPSCMSKLFRVDGRADRRMQKRTEQRLTRAPNRYGFESAIGAMCSATGVDPAVATVGRFNTEDDARWFRDNPDRSHRLRPALSGEEADLYDPGVQPLETQCWVAIRQVAPGMRQRLPMFVPSELAGICQQQAKFEPIVHALFDLRIQRNSHEDIGFKDLVDLLNQRMQTTEQTH